METLEYINLFKSSIKRYHYYLMSLEDVSDKESMKSLVNKIYEDIFEDEKTIEDIYLSGKQISKPLVESIAALRKNYNMTLDFIKTYKILNDI